MQASAASLRTIVVEEVPPPSLRAGQVRLCVHAVGFGFQMLLKGCSLVGVFWGSHTRKEPEVHAANLQALFRLFNEGMIKPHVTEPGGLTWRP